MTSLRPSRASGYTLILPPGWLRLDARSTQGTAELDRELDRVLAAVPRDSFGPLISQARKQAHAVLDRARTARALDLYLPLGGTHGTAVPASFLVSMVQLQGESPRAGTRVDYHWPMPSQPRKWALASFTTIGAGKPDDDIAEVLVGLFDAIMLTWRWQTGPRDLTTVGPRWSPIDRWAGRGVRGRSRVVAPGV